MATPQLVLPAATRRQLLVGATALAATGLTAGRASAGTFAAPAAPAAPAYLASTSSAAAQSARVHGWATDTWRSLVAMTDPKTGLPADNIAESLAAGDRSGYTSPTNIGGYLWSAVVARELGIISRAECTKRLVQTLNTLLRMEHHEPSGMYYNWYDEATGEKLTTWPTDGSRVDPFLSSVDNGWLGAALRVVMTSDKGAAPLANRLFSRMRWDSFYDPNASRKPGLMHGGFFVVQPPDRTDGFYGNHIGIGPDVWLTNHHYDTTVSETRITSYLGILTGQVPKEHYFAMWRTFPATCDWSWHEMQPVGENRTYFGVDVYEGAYTYRGMHVVPGWGGSMFEELMPDVFVPESSWAPRSWGLNHTLHVRAQREYGLSETGYGYWGFSPSSNPMGGYREFGVDQLGMKPDGYLSDIDTTDPKFVGTNYDAGFGDCREGINPNPAYRDGVVTPHAAFLAMMHEPDQAFTNLAKIQDELKAYGTGGFFDAVAVKSGLIARRYLSLDQAMVMGAIGNVLADNVIRRAFSTADVERALRPVIGVEEFGAGIA
ncbi:glucoamylase family protein [Phycicoccus sp. Soil803]|uniref:glucoamylase family protein n=1 Tax=Phycicoccus sp. Soil803 TaxID=1736415 RepID=UPI0007098536|nr:glucoamylase family protein [Phycicoccus sp. Soil803]KRF23191.1 cellobiose phosphorylase [Phycicoccus sp. Soil803]